MLYQNGCPDVGATLPRLRMGRVHRRANLRAPVCTESASGQVLLLVFVFRVLSFRVAVVSVARKQPPVPLMFLVDWFFAGLGYLGASHAYTHDS